METQGADKHKNFIPRGMLHFTAWKQRVSDFCVQSIWKNYVERNSLSLLKPGFVKGLHRKLTVEDEEYIESLLIIQPSIYKEEIRQKLLRFSNTLNYPNASPADISLTTIKRTVRHRYL